MTDDCSRCGLPVYFAEIVQACGTTFHRKCFVCSNPSCSRSLDSRMCNDKNGKPYCNHCYKTLFGPKGVGYGIGSGVLSTEGLIRRDEPIDTNYYNNNDNTSFNFEGLKISYGIDKSDPVTSVTSYGVNPRDDRFVERLGIVPATIIRGAGSLSPASTEASVDSNDSNEPIRFTRQHQRAVAAAHLQKDRSCGKCGKTVYDAEKVYAAQKTFHKDTCYTCTSCNKRLESRTQCEYKNDLYCTACYARSFGPKGYGHGVGAGILQLHQ